MNQPRILQAAPVLAACILALPGLTAERPEVDDFTYGGRSFELHPVTFKEKPAVPSPCRADDEALDPVFPTKDASIPLYRGPI